jgi:hypothetical protein
MYIVQPDLMVTGLPSGTFIFDLPIKKSVFFHSYVSLPEGNVGETMS